MKIHPWLAALCLTLISACSYNHEGLNDPYEKTNRKIFDFNMELISKTHKNTNDDTVDDEAIDNEDPNGLIIMAENFFNNLYEINNMAHDILQFQWGFLLNDFWRFTLNSTLGLFGTIDVAKHLGLPHHTQTLTRTFAYWNLKNPPYLVLPLIGPSDATQIMSLPMDYSVLSPFGDIHDLKRHFITEYLNLLYIYHTTKDLQGMVEDAIDPYIFVRDAYLQRRAMLEERENYEEMKLDHMDMLKEEAMEDDEEYDE